MQVHGPSFLNLGFAGAPIATAFSYNVVAALCVMYLLCRPRRFHEVKGEVVLRPSLMDTFKTLLFLGLAGVGKCFLPYFLDTASDLGVSS